VAAGATTPSRRAEKLAGVHQPVNEVLGRAPRGGHRPERPRCPSPVDQELAVRAVPAASRPYWLPENRGRLDEFGLATPASRRGELGLHRLCGAMTERHLHALNPPRPPQCGGVHRRHRAALDHRRRDELRPDLVGAGPARPKEERISHDRRRPIALGLTRVRPCPTTTRG